VSKGGRTDIDLSKYDKTAYLRYCEEYEIARYKEANCGKRFVLLLGRIPFIVSLFLGVFMIIGVINIVLGVQLGRTYSQRMERAVEVTAVLVDVEKDRDDDGKRVYDCLYAYEYRGKTYTHEETVIKKPEAGKEMRLTIDSQKPEEEMKGNGQLELIVGTVFFSVSLLLTIVALWRMSVTMKRKIEKKG